MSTLKDWSARLMVCAVVAVMCSAAPVTAGIEPLLHRDGFEPPDPQALVLDAANASGGIRVAATEYWYSHLELPASVGVLGFDDPQPVATALATLDSGVLVLDFEGNLAGSSLAFAPWLQSGTLHWVCGHAPPPLDATLLSGSTSSAHTTLPDSLLPDGCSTPSPTTLVEETWLASSPARGAVSAHWMTVGPPASLAEVGLDDPLPVGQARLQLDDGLLVATFVDPLVDETLAIALWEQAGALRWVCGYAPAPVDATLLSGATSATRTSLPEAWLPEPCRSNPSLATQVADALLGMAVARLAISEFWLSELALPATLAEAGLQDPLPVAQARLQLEDGVLVAHFAGDLEGELLGMAPWEGDDTVLWVCGHAEAPPGATPLASGSASAHTTLDDALLPVGCR